MNSHLTQNLKPAELAVPLKNVNAGGKQMRRINHRQLKVYQMSCRDILPLDCYVHKIMNTSVKGSSQHKGTDEESRIESDSLAATQPQDQMQSAFLLNVIVRKSTTILKLFSSKNQALLVGRDAFFILNLRLHVVNGIGRLHFKGDGFTGESLDEDLHSTAKTKDQMKGRLLLDIVVGECTTILELLPCKDKTLLVRRDALLVLDLRLDVIDGVRRLDLECYGLAGEGLDEDLHSSSEAKNKVKGRLFLNIGVRKSATVFQLLSSKNETLLVGGNAFLVLDLRLYVVDGVAGLYLKGNSLAG